MAYFKTLDPSDIKTSTSYLNQLIDVLENMMSGSQNRRKYQVFVTSSADAIGTVYAVTGGLFQTAYDQDYTLATANPVLGMTVGIFSGSDTVTGSLSGYDSLGKMLFPSTSLMMREKIANYREFASKLLGDADLQFSSPFTTPGATDYIDEALFLSFNRLFFRDQIKKETFAIQMYASASTTAAIPNINTQSTLGKTIYSDVGAASAVEVAYGGSVGNIVSTTNTNNKVGLLFYDAGIAVLDVKKIISGTQLASGTISAVTGSTSPVLNNKTIVGRTSFPSSNVNAKFIPDFFVSGSIDDIVDHFGLTRFGTGSETSITFQNITNINSSLVFCRATADEFNYSTNPTFTDENGRIVVIDEGEETTQRTFSFITSVGLYNAAGDLLAVAKISRAVEKSDEKDLTIRVRLDF